MKKSWILFIEYQPWFEEESSTVRFISTVTKVNFKKSMKKCLKIREIFAEVRIHLDICLTVVFSPLNHVS